MNGTIDYPRWRAEQRRAKQLALMILLGFAAWSLAPLALAGGCGVAAVCQPARVVAPVVTHRAAVVHHAAVVEPVPPVQHQAAINNVFYGVGQPVVQEAMVARAFRSVLQEYQFNATVNGTVSGTITGGAAGGAQAASTYATPPQASSPQFSFTAPQQGVDRLPAQCAACHSGPRSDGQFNAATATPQQWQSAARRVLNGTMPPSGALSPEEQITALRKIVGAN